MAEEISRKRLAKRRKKAERRRLQREQEEVDKKMNFRTEILMKIGIFAVLAFIPIDFFVKFYPIITGTLLTFEVAAIAFIFIEILGILFGLGLYYAGKKMTRDTGIYSGMFQIDGSIIGIVSITIFLIANPLPYTQADLIVNSLFYGLETISSIALLIFSLLIAFFFIIVGSNSQKQPLKYIIMITGVLWIIELFIPIFIPAPTADIRLYSIIAGLTWVVYGLTAYCFWKIISDYEGLKPLAAEPYRIK
ncbi:MAG: hypothetical protein HWN66_10805 [Candidatus Helarchaeota archaeon]|nr:hypothetical protein [Candidatus Helarchaeota archaeon]